MCIYTHSDVQYCDSKLDECMHDFVAAKRVKVCKCFVFLLMLMRPLLGTGRSAKQSTRKSRDLAESTEMGQWDAGSESALTTSPKALRNRETVVIELPNDAPLNQTTIWLLSLRLALSSLASWHLSDAICVKPEALIYPSLMPRPLKLVNIKACKFLIARFETLLGTG